MKTELENYFELIDGFLDKSHKYVVEVNNIGGEIEGKKSITFYEVKDFRDIGISGIEPYPHTHFSFVPKKFDEKYLFDIELGVANLRERGYKVAYVNNLQDKINEDGKA